MTDLPTCSSNTSVWCLRRRKYHSRGGIGVLRISKVRVSRAATTPFCPHLCLGQDLAFLVSNKTAFELPLTNVANSNIAGRTEVSLEFAPRSAKPSRHGPDEMVEIRFYVPGTHTKERGSDAGSEKSDNEDDGEEISAAQAFHDLVKEKAELGQVSGNIILSFDEVNVLTPRGRYDVDMYPEFLRLRGRTYDYKILYGSISKLFLLPKDDLHVLFIVGDIANACIMCPHNCSRSSV